MNLFLFNFAPYIFLVGAGLAVGYFSVKASDYILRIAKSDRRLG